MMLEQARSSRERLTRADIASASVEEAAALSKKKIELESWVEEIKRLSKRRAMLRAGGVTLSQSTDVKSVNKQCRMILDRFNEVSKAVTLVDKQRWVKLTEAILQFSASEETLQKMDWKAYFVTKLFGGVSPEQRKLTIVMTLPDNQNEWDRYKRLYMRFSDYRNNLPISAEDLEEVKTLSERLSTIKFIENDDVPLEVREFFNATSTSSGASIELLTAPVVSWLRTHDMLNNYAVRAR